jgi:hypothetical protein
MVPAARTILCRAHNNDTHRQRWRTRRALNGSRYTVREDGTIMLPVGTFRPSFAEGLDDANDGYLDDNHLDAPVWPEDAAGTTVIAPNRIVDLLRTG